MVASINRSGARLPDNEDEVVVDGVAVLEGLAQLAAAGDFIELAGVCRADHTGPEICDFRTNRSRSYRRSLPASVGKRGTHARSQGRHAVPVLGDIVVRSDMVSCRSISGGGNVHSHGRICWIHSVRTLAVDVRRTQLVLCRRSRCALDRCDR